MNLLVVLDGQGRRAPALGCCEHSTERPFPGHDPCVSRGVTQPTVSMGEMRRSTGGRARDGRAPPGGPTTGAGARHTVLTCPPRGEPRPSPPTVGAVPRRRARAVAARPRDRGLPAPPRRRPRRLADVPGRRRCSSSATSRAGERRPSSRSASSPLLNDPPRVRDGLDGRAPPLRHAGLAGAARGRSRCRSSCAPLLLCLFVPAVLTAARRPRASTTSCGRHAHRPALSGTPPDRVPPLASDVSRDVPL